MSGDFPGFPTLAKVPLTARATVTEATSTGRSGPAPVQVASTSSNLEHRNKGDPLLTRLLYGMLAWFNNVPLEKGYSQVDWLKKLRATPAPPLRRDITMEEVKQHRTREDAWMVFRNRVYDITPYLKFHPGGPDILMKAAGRDGTALFMKYHPWVNIDALMEKCLVGLLAETEGPQQGQGAAGPQGTQGPAQPQGTQAPQQPSQQPTQSPLGDAVSAGGSLQGEGVASQPPVVLTSSAPPPTEQPAQQAAEQTEAPLPSTAPSIQPPGVSSNTAQ